MQPPRCFKNFLIVFIFISGVGSEPLRLAHRLCAVSAETLSDIPNTSSGTTVQTASAKLQRHNIAWNASDGISRGSWSTENFAVNASQNNDDVARYTSDGNQASVSSAVTDRGTQRTSVNPDKHDTKETYGERLRRLSTKGSYNEKPRGGTAVIRDEPAPTVEVKPRKVYSSEAVEYVNILGGIPKDKSSLASAKPLPGNAAHVNFVTSASSKEAVLLYSDDNQERVPETERTEVSGKRTPSEVVNGSVPTEVARSPEAEEDVLRHETRQALLKDIEEKWAVQKSQSVPNSPEDSARIPLPSLPNETLQQYAKHIILPQIRVEKMPFSEVLKMISEAVKVCSQNERTVNFILADPKKTAPDIDLDIKDVSLERVLHYLCEMTQFTVLYEGNTVIFRDPSLKQALRTCMFPISRGSVLQILSYTDLNNSDNEKKLSEEERLKHFFQRIGVPMEDKNIGFAYDGSNLIITHEELWLQRIEGILQQYRQCKQIAIEAKFLEVQQGALDELGFQFDTGTQNGARVKVNMEGGGLRNLSSLEGGKTNTATWTVPNELDYGSNYGALLIANPVLNSYQMRAVLRAIEQRSDSDLMCTPRVTVLSGRKAEIVVADEFRYPQSYRDGIANVGNDGRNQPAAGVAILGGAPENFTTRNIGIEMIVTPVAESNGRIHLTLEPRVTQLSGFVDYGGSNIISGHDGTHGYSSGFKQPTFATRKIKTELSIKSGSTVVMGGLTREEVKEMHDRIPLFGDIPIFGKLFQTNGKTSQKKNLLIFVTANLVDENGQYIVEPEFKVAKSP